MKTSIIPAQITTVEDRIAANLSFTQLLLLTLPLFLTVVIFFLVPPFGRFSLYKMISALLLISFFSILAIRINGKLFLDVIRLRVKFANRPHIYVSQKHLVSAIDDYIQFVLYKPSGTSLLSGKNRLATSLDVNTVRLLEDMDYKVVFLSKKGGLNVKVSDS